jgi:uncharacterized protein YihD (DUF1040 family)
MEIGEVMRNPDRIPYIVSLIAQGWQKTPDLRIGQIFENLKRYSGKDDLFYMEDDEFVRLIIDYFDLDEQLDVALFIADNDYNFEIGV